MKKEILTEKHNSWKGFCLQLSNIMYENNKGECSGDFTETIKIIKKLYNVNIDVDNTIKYLKDNGCKCDCDIIKNYDIFPIWEYMNVGERQKILESYGL